MSVLRISKSGIRVPFRSSVWSALAALAVGVSILFVSSVFAQSFDPPADHDQVLGVTGYFTASHKTGYLDPTNSDCGTCHGSDLKGGAAPSCYTCHGEAWGPGGLTDGGPPESHTVLMTQMPDDLGDANCSFCHNVHGGLFSRTKFWHAPGFEEPYRNGCTRCHGPTLDGSNGFARSCFWCHRWDYHNFSRESWLPPGEVRCMPCHDGPDWNHDLSPTAGYKVSKTTLARVGDPTGNSAECMGCHEGNVAVDSFGGNAGNVFIMGSNAFGSDLSHHHPVSFAYDGALVAAHGGLKDPTTAPSGLTPSGTIAEDMLEGGQVQCRSCHDPHDIYTWAYLVKSPSELCFTCHDQTAPAPTDRRHHMPRREQPWGEFGCTMCHGGNLEGYASAPPCTQCHNEFIYPDAPPTGHHGGNRFDPQAECGVCHADPNTGELTGAPYATVGSTVISTPSCITGCHDASLWTGNRPPVADAGGPYQGYVGQAVTLDGSLTTDPDGDQLEYVWLFGDGSSPTLASSSPTAQHTYLAPGTYQAELSVTDGIHRPVTVSVTVEISDQPPPPATHEPWDVTVIGASNYRIEIKQQGGGFYGVTYDGAGATGLAFGVETGNVIFWVDVILDMGNLTWGTGAVYFGNIDRSRGEMSGVVIQPNGAVGSFHGIRR